MGLVNYMPKPFLMSPSSPPSKMEIAIILKEILRKVADFNHKCAGVDLIDGNKKLVRCRIVSDYSRPIG